MKSFFLSCVCVTDFKPRNAQGRDTNAHLKLLKGISRGCITRCRGIFKFKRVPRGVEDSCYKAGVTRAHEVVKAVGLEDCDAANAKVTLEIPGTRILMSKGHDAF